MKRVTSGWLESSCEVELVYILRRPTHVRRGESQVGPLGTADRIKPDRICADVRGT
jgi:hypothetical protein